MGRIEKDFLPNYEGKYSNTTQYKKMSVVEYNGNQYIGIKDIIPLGTLPTNNSYFKLYLDLEQKADKKELENKVDKEKGKELVDSKLVGFLSTLNKNYDSDKIESIIENYFAITADQNTYGIEKPIWSVSNTTEFTKYGANEDKYIEPATDTKFEKTNYPDSFKGIRCNAYVDDEGKRHITALQGMPNFKDTGKNDVFTIFRTRYEKAGVRDSKEFYEMRFVPTEGYTPNSLAVEKDGTVRGFILIPTFVAGVIEEGGIRNLYGSKGLIPAHYMSEVTGDIKSDTICYSGCINYGKRRGKYYTAGLSSEVAFLKMQMWLMFGTTNITKHLAGNFNNNQQVKVSMAEENTNRVVLTTAQANNFDLKTYVSVGDVGSHTDKDRRFGYVHNLAYVVRIIGKEVVDDTHTALILDCPAFTISNVDTTYVTTMYERSGYSDEILGQTGSIISNTNGRHGAVFCGVEVFVGGYEVFGNAVMDIVSADGTRDVYVTKDATKLTTDIATIKNTYKKSPYQVTATTLGNWNYITEEGIDLENGIIVPTQSGQSGSGSGVGYADGCFLDTGTSGQREFLAFGHLGAGAPAGLSFLNGHDSLGAAWWYLLCRLSINAVGGELVA